MENNIIETVDCKKSLATFSFDQIGAKEKVNKKKNAKKDISTPAGVEEAYAASTAQTFKTV